MTNSIRKSHSIGRLVLYGRVHYIKILWFNCRNLQTSKYMCQRGYLHWNMYGRWKAQMYCFMVNKRKPFFLPCLTNVEGSHLRGEHSMWYKNCLQFLMIKRGPDPMSQKTFRYTIYLCYLLLSKHRQIFETNKL